MVEIIIDMDGTLSNETIGDIIDSRDLAADDYEPVREALAQFTPRKGVDIINSYGVKPIIITGRQESLRAATEVWLHSYKIPFKKLIMIPDGYYGNKFDWNKYVDYKVKAHQQYDVRFSIDDSEGVVTVLKKHGIPAFLVGDDFEETFMEAWNETS
jgi:hypothetical protein